MANPGNRHCASCIGTLSFPIATPPEEDRATATCSLKIISLHFLSHPVGQMSSVGAMWTRLMLVDSSSCCYDSCGC